LLATNAPFLLIFHLPSFSYSFFPSQNLLFNPSKKSKPQPKNLSKILTREIFFHLILKSKVSPLISKDVLLIIKREGGKTSASEGKKNKIFSHNKIKKQNKNNPLKKKHKTMSDCLGYVQCLISEGKCETGYIIGKDDGSIWACSNGLQAVCF